MKFMNKYNIYIGLWMTLGLTACRQAPSASEKGDAAAADQMGPTVTVKTETVITETMPKYLTLTGDILAVDESELAADVAGRVTATYVERGQPVKRGQALMRVDAKAAKLQAKAASSQSKAAEAQVEQARNDCARAETLREQGVLTQADYERQKTQCATQLYQANAARAQADLAGKLAKDTVIRSPMDGLVGERLVNVGEYVTPASQVAKVYAIDPVRVQISVPEPAISRVKDGQSVTLHVAAYPDREFTAVVRLVSPALRERTRDLIVEAFADNPDKLLLPGMFATVKLLVGEEKTPTVPTNALIVDGTVSRLFLAKGGAAYEMVVPTGVTKNGRTAIKEALPSNERVILNPPPGLRDGSPIVD